MSFRRLGCAALAALIALPALSLADASAAKRVPRASASQWALQAISAPTAWKRAQGAGVTVAIVDSGAALSHPDLAPSLWVNSGEVPGNGLDDDANGYADDVNGFDFVDDDPDPSDLNGHGTHVAGTVAAACRTLCGVAPKAKLMILRVLDANAGGTTRDVARAVRYAVDNGARVVNLSLAGPSSDPDLESAIAAAGARGVTVVAAAGNAASDTDLSPFYPAATIAPNLVSVAATSPGGALAASSNFGRRTITLAAPGDAIVSTALHGTAEYRSGTSMAAAVTSGALADLLSAKRGATPGTLRAALTDTAARGVPVTAGRIRLERALDRLVGKAKKAKRKHRKRSGRAR